jgi:hypothetical protein
MKFNDFSRVGIVVALISLAFAIQRVPIDSLIKATFLMVLVALLFIVAAVNRKSIDE